MIKTLDFFYCSLGDVKFQIWHRTVLRKLGNNYQLFFRILGFEPEDIQTAQQNHNQNAAMIKQELWDQ